MSAFKWLGPVILAGALLYSVLSVVSNDLKYNAPDVPTIKICHWQLETGFREALQDCINEYENQYFQAHGRKVRILQVPVSENGYQEYMNTTIIGGNAPDILERGGGKTATDSAYAARFFVPLGPYIEQPNPYDQGTALAGIPWKDTFFDGLESMYDTTLMDYYSIPFAADTVRIYYNEELYRKLTGRTEPPGNFSEFIALCQKARESAEEDGQPIVPIAGSKYQATIFESMYLDPFLLGLIPAADLFADHTVDTFGAYLAYRKGLWRFDSAPLLAMWRCMVDIAKNFQAGWLADKRDDAVFIFAQGRALMIASGTWDASSIIDQVGQVHRRRLRLPPPGRRSGLRSLRRRSDERVDHGRWNPVAVTRQSRHQDICIDFLRFCTTVARNERFSDEISWLPVIRGAKFGKRLKPFKPHPEGFTGTFDYKLGTEVTMIAAGNSWALYSGKMPPEDFARGLDELSTSAPASRSFGWVWTRAPGTSATWIASWPRCWSGNAMRLRRTPAISRHGSSRSCSPRNGAASSSRPTRPAIATSFPGPATGHERTADYI